MIKKTEAQLDKFIRFMYCEHCREYCMPDEGKRKKCPELKKFYKEKKNGKSGIGVVR